MGVGERSLSDQIEITVPGYFHAPPDASPDAGPKPAVLFIPQQSHHWRLHQVQHLIESLGPAVILDALQRQRVANKMSAASPFRWCLVGGSIYLH
jgi:hypothetical protein